MKEGKAPDQAQTAHTGPDAELLCNDLSSQREVSVFPVGRKDFLSCSCSSGQVSGSSHYSFLSGRNAGIGWGQVSGESLFITQGQERRGERHGHNDA